MKQACSPDWFLQRKLRITASVGHKIVRGRKKETRWKYFYQHIPNLPSLEYGRRTETVAKASFSALTGFQVSNVGLVVRADQPWLASTPDGIFRDSSENIALLEVKCPISCKGAMIDVEYIQDGELKKSHPYYTQVQLQMYTCNCDVCYFFVYSSADQFLTIVERDEELL